MPGGKRVLIENELLNFARCTIFVERAGFPPISEIRETWSFKPRLGKKN